MSTLVRKNVRFFYPSSFSKGLSIERIGKVEKEGTGPNGDFLTIQLPTGGFKSFSRKDITDLKVL